MAQAVGSFRSTYISTHRPESRCHMYYRSSSIFHSRRLIGGERFFFVFLIHAGLVPGGKVKGT